ncbi:MAG: HDIG domain-containing metalloprotein [bacterium]
MASSTTSTSGGGGGGGGERSGRGRLRPAPAVLRWVVLRPAVVWSMLIVAGLGCVLAALMVLAGTRPILAVGQIADHTRAVRAPVAIANRAATAADREAARERAPRVYRADERVLGELRRQLENLPRAVADAPNAASIDEATRTLFPLSEAGLTALKGAAAGNGERAWMAAVERLMALVMRTPVLEPGAYQREVASAAAALELLGPEAGPGDGSGVAPPGVLVSPREALKAGSAQASDALARLAEAAGMPPAVQDAVAFRLRLLTSPTYRFADTETLARQAEAERSVPEQTKRAFPGQVIYLRGEKITSDQLDLLYAENAAYRASLAWWQRAALDGGSASAGLLLALALLAFVRTHAPNLLADVRRFGALAAAFGGGMALAVWVAITEPWLAGMAVAGPVTLVAMLIAVVFERKMALVLGALLAIGAAIALRQPVASCAVALCGVAVVAWILKEVRARNTLIAAGLFAGVAVAGGTLMLGLLHRQPTMEGLQQAAWEAATSGLGVAASGFLVLGCLPGIERLLGVTTGMTLIELRDPRHPLLRALQQRAPGTYNHSLNVASLAEAAADAIGADPLLAYVGALYHDVGKMNKPEYFAENQTGGFNRHDRLTPAMSLLVIVGHVHDGLELADEYRLPQPLMHFIEGHHGTTLVEYFYHRARKQAEAAMAAAGGASGGAGGGGGGAGAGVGMPGGVPESIPGQLPSEFEYRYPGPKPRTKEVAIVMVCDAAESATRTLPDPSPTRIDTLVRAIANKRLGDGQFDECDLTLRELSLITEAISRTLAAIHHQRVVYPEAAMRGGGGGGGGGTAGAGSAGGGLAAARVG